MSKTEARRRSKTERRMLRRMLETSNEAHHNIRLPVKYIDKRMALEI